jgi:hypothetical protein
MNTKIKCIALIFSCFTAMNIAIADSGSVQSNEDKVVPAPTVPVMQSQQELRLHNQSRAGGCTWLSHAKIDALQTDMINYLSILVGGKYYTYIPGNPMAIAEAARLMEDLSFRGIPLRLCIANAYYVEGFFWNR